VDRAPVTSSCIASVGYDEASSVLEVEFSEGYVYRYFDVPEEVVREFLGSPSLGRYLNAYIRDAYRYSRSD
jgi:hypothetical protein